VAGGPQSPGNRGQPASQDVRAFALPCRLLDRTPSERSEDKLVFLINVRLFELSPRSASSKGGSNGIHCRVGWALMMRAIK